MDMGSLLKKVNKDYVTVILLAVMGLFMYLYFNTDDFNDVDHSGIKELQLKADSLAKSLYQKDLAIKLMTEEHQKAVQDLEINYQKRLANINAKYIKERDKIKDLPITEQVKLLSDNLSDPPDPIIQGIDGDTNVILQPKHIVAINQVFLERGTLLEQYGICELSRNSLRSEVDQGLFLIKEKEDVIKGYQELNNQNDKIILDMGTKAENDAKIARRSKFRTAVKSFVGGVVVGGVVVGGFAVAILRK